jgi:hypothetical protein
MLVPSKTDKLIPCSSKDVGIDGFIGRALVGFGNGHFLGRLRNLTDVTEIEGGALPSVLWRWYGGRLHFGRWPDKYFRNLVYKGFLGGRIL